MTNQISALSSNICSLFEQVKDPHQIQADARKLYSLLQREPYLCEEQKDYYCFSKALFISYLALLDDITLDKNYERFILMVYYTLIRYLVREETESEYPKEYLSTEILAYCFCFLYRKECFNKVAELTMQYYVPSSAARQVWGFMIYLYWNSKSALIEEKKPSFIERLFGRGKEKTDNPSFTISPFLRPIYEANYNKNQKALQNSPDDDQLAKLATHIKTSLLKDHLQSAESIIIDWQEQTDFDRELDQEMYMDSMDF
jgi:glycosyltransferase involved in cell wall biosynthesis